MAPERIDFKEFLPRYNKRNGTDFKSVKAMLLHCWHKTGNQDAIAAVLGVSSNTVKDRFRKYRISGRKASRFVSPYLAINGIETMTRAEVAGHIGCCLATVEWLARTTGKQYARGKRK